MTRSLLRDALYHLGSLIPRPPAWWNQRARIHQSEGSFIHSTVTVTGAPASDKCSVSLGNMVHIMEGCELQPGPSGITIGDGTILHAHGSLMGDIRIGRHCLISKFFYASSGSHDISKPSLIRYNDSLQSSHTSLPVRIDDDVWIGFNVFVRSGVTIYRGAVIGAGSVVTKDVAPYHVVAGNPARVIKKRFEFDCPETLDSADESHLPYFYSGFDQRNSSSTPDGYQALDPRSFISAPSHFSSGSVRISGHCLYRDQLRVGSSPAQEISPGHFEVASRVTPSEIAVGPAPGITVEFGTAAAFKIRSVSFR
jgi:acetyltransferase-like isoleucine patch superfamily enzyme